jgi:DNA invertase Pin-like site-specific DNA recombinase
MTIVGYARVSTAGQTLATQVEALKQAGAQLIFQETASGDKSDREQLVKVIATLASGDTLLICRLDRLAQSTMDMCKTLHAVTKKGADFKSLAAAWADITTLHGRRD